MSLSAFCVLLGLWELIIGLPLALRPAATGGWLEELLEQEHWLRLACFLFLAASVLTLWSAPPLESSAQGVVQVLAWLTAGKCLFGCWWPRRLAALSTGWRRSPGRMRLLGILATGLGAWLLQVSRSI